MTERKIILVVEDQADIRQLIRMTLEFGPYEVHEAENGESGWRMVQALGPDLVLLDVTMPGSLDGYQVCQKVKVERSLQHIPVVMLTGKSSTFDRVKGTFAGCDTYLTKPVDSTVFQNVLMRYLNINTDDFRAMAMAT